MQKDSWNHLASNVSATVASEDTRSELAPVKVAAAPNVPSDVASIAVAK